MRRYGTLPPAVWSALDVFSKQGLQFFVSIALARLLGPEAFGAIALVMAITSFAGVFVDAGFGAALVHKRDATHTDESSVFWFNLGVATLLSLCMSFAAPWIATSFGMSELTAVIIACSGIMIVTAASSVHAALLSKELDFKTQAKVTVTTTVFSGGVAVGLAVAGFGVWALVGQAATSAAVTTGLYWILSDWRPSFVLSLKSLWSLSSFGGYMMLTILIDTAAARASAFALGALYPPEQLGFYSRAESTALLPASLLQRVVPRVAFSTYTPLAHDHEALRREVRRALGIVNLIAAPMMMGLAAVAGPVVVSLFGEKWEPSIPLLQVLALAGLGMPYQVVNLSALMAMGRSRLFFKMHFIKKLISIGLVCLAASFGPYLVAWAVLASALVGVLFDMAVPGGLIGLSVYSQLSAAAPTFIAAGAMGGVVFVIVNSLSYAPQMSLIVGVVIGVAFYLAAIAALRVKAAQELMTTLRGLSAP